MLVLGYKSSKWLEEDNSRMRTEIYRREHNTVGEETWKKKEGKNVEQVRHREEDI